ncbi:MAG: hypothetical protein ACYC4K_04760 [Thiobacillus sp.]
MSKLKDKLSANMRTVKANQPHTPAKSAPAHAAPAKSQAAEKPVSKPKPQVSAPKKVPGDVANTGTSLFPDRVWPD